MSYMETNRKKHIMLLFLFFKIMVIKLIDRNQNWNIKYYLIKIKQN